VQTKPRLARSACSGLFHCGEHPQRCRRGRDLPGHLAARAPAAQVRRTVDVTRTIASEDAAGSGQVRSTLTTADGTRAFRIGNRTSAHVRHWHKYAAIPLPVSRRFYFHRQDPSEPQVAAATLEEFTRWVRECDLDVIEHHLS